MKKFIMTAALIACSLNAFAAQPDEVYVCDSQVFNVLTNQQGSFVLDAAKIERTGNHYRVSLDSDIGTAVYNYVKDSASSKVIGGVKYHFVRSHAESNTFDFVELDNHQALSYISDTTGSGNQLQLQCKLK